ncbi:MAG: MCE family protein [Nevskiaceae bacterium]|nr:MAG: MCE family protein [Nevskiaceae bacterium]TBR72112.1 MAG: MCE family protein [Nevskiaceae bacterium]
MNEGREQELPQPEVVPRSRWRVSTVWLVPVVAILVGLGLAVNSALQRGPTLSIVFDNAQWITAGQTQLKYKNVVVGRVTSVGFDSDFRKVIVKVALQRDATRLARADSRFWIVRPRVDLGGVSGLGTLLSGAYIEVDPGISDQRQTQFVALSQPPAVLRGGAGRSFVLHAVDVGSLSAGSRVYYRRFAVGRVTGMQLEPDGKGARVDIFVTAPYDALVHTTTRFWNASGVDVSIGTAGLKVNTQSLGSILAGGVAFGDRSGAEAVMPAAADASFELFPNEVAALAPDDGIARHVRMRFDQSVRGLDVGSEVDLRGFAVGKVTSIEMHYDTAQGELYAEVDADIYPRRLGPAEDAVERLAKADTPDDVRLVAALVAKGLRAQLRTGNLISGQLYVALDFFPHARAVKYDPTEQVAMIPTMPGSLEQLQQQVVEIVRKLNNVPFDQIGTELATTLARTNDLLGSLNGQVAPQAAAALEQAQKTLAVAQRALLSPQSRLQRDTGRTLDEVRAAAQSLQEFADYLQRHPEALLRGRGHDAPPPLERQR